MNFFNDIGRGFQDFGNTINNEVIKPVEHEVLKIQDVPKQIENIPNKIETQINNELKKINPRLRLPPPKVITTKDINERIKKELQDAIIKPFERDVIHPSQKISDDIKKGFEKEIIKPSQKVSNDIQTGFQKDIIDGFQTKIINPTDNFFDKAGDVLNSLNQGGSKKTTDSNIGSYDLLIFSGIGLLVAYIILK